MSIYLSLTLFALSVTSIFFILPLSGMRFAKNDILHHILKRGMLAIGIYLLTYDAVLMANLAAEAVLGVNGATTILLSNDIKRFMWQFMYMSGTAGWVTLGYLVFKTILEVMGMWKLKKTSTRMGEDEDE